MISAARFLGLVAACATLLIAGLEPASAQDDACKVDAVTAAGRAKFRPFSKKKELEGKGAAMADAVANWQREVASRFGDKWKQWSEARGKDFDCAPTKTGKIIGSSFIGCSISGRPCSPGAPPADEKVVDDDSRGGKGRTRDDDSRGGRGRTRDEDRRVAGGERLQKGSWAYQREMARQNYLAAERRRSESRAYDREMARQRFLATARRRAESRAWSREDARQRYLAAERRRVEHDLSRGFN